MHCSLRSTIQSGWNSTQNSHLWATIYLIRTAESSRQHQFSENVWCGSTGDLLISPFILEHLTAVNYLYFLTNELLHSMKDVPLETMLLRRHTLSLAPPHFGQAMSYLNQCYSNQCTGHAGPIPWLLRPLDLNCWTSVESYEREDLYDQNLDESGTLASNYKCWCLQSRTPQNGTMGSKLVVWIKQDYALKTMVDILIS